MTKMKLRCFVIMPFAPSFDIVFGVIRDAAEHAVTGYETECFRLKEVKAAGKITDDIVNAIRSASICVADVSGNNPNVMWETGYAMAVGKPTVLIGRHVEQLPFNLKDYRIHEYDSDRLDVLRDSLTEAIRQTLSHYDLEPSVGTASPQVGAGLVIAVTGSMSTRQSRAVRRVEQMLNPYLSANTIWYIGSNGIVDDVTAAYLVANGQSVVAVGYHRYDLSSAMFRLIQEGKVAFLDASVESVPRGHKAPSDRDALFCAKADIAVLFWDGESPGTGKLVRYFEDSAKNLLIGFL